MKMKKLMEGWRRFVLNEGVGTAESLPENVGVFIDTEQSPDEIGFSFVEMSDGSPSDQPYGEVRISNMATQDSEWVGNCLDGWVVSFAKTDNGWAPLLYDVAIEWASMRSTGAGLAPDRSKVDDETYSVWEQYMESRPDVEVQQLDDMDNSLTSDEGDNCAQNAAVSAAATRDSNWSQTPISKLYSKKSPATIEKLQALGRLIFKEEN